MCEADRRADGRTDGQTDCRTAGHADGRAGGLADGQAGGLAGGRYGNRTDGRTIGRTGGRAIGRTDGWTNRRTVIRTVSPLSPGPRLHAIYTPANRGRGCSDSWMPADMQPPDRSITSSQPQNLKKQNLSPDEAIARLAWVSRISQRARMQAQ